MRMHRYTVLNEAYHVRISTLCCILVGSNLGAAILVYLLLEESKENTPVLEFCIHHLHIST